MLFREEAGGEGEEGSLALWELHTNIQRVNPEAVEGVEPSNNSFSSITLA